MSEHTIPFQPRRFEGAAPHYLQGRPSYAPALIHRVATRVGLDLSHRVLDLGCGPGQLASGFAYLAGSVLAIDPEPEMLAIATARCEGITPNVTFLQGSSYDLGPPLGRFRLVAIGRAFHWMDRAETLGRLDAMIEAGGAVALFSDHHPEVPDNAWLAEYREMRTRHIGADRPSWRQPGWPSHESVLLDSRFSRLERIGIIERRTIPTDSLLNRSQSMSSASRTRIGAARADALAADVAALAARIATDGRIHEVVESVALIAFRDK